MFKSVLMLEEAKDEMEESEEIEFVDDDTESNTYTVPVKGTKITYKKPN